MPRALFAFIRGGFPRNDSLSFTSFAVVLLAAATLLVASAGSTTAQDWESDPEDDWSSPSSDSSSLGSRPGWGLRAGVGFTAGPDMFLMNFEVPYQFDRWVTAGPMLQVGVKSDEHIIAPTMNVGITIPDMPGDALDRLQPYGFAGLGFAALHDKDRRGNSTSAGLLIPIGFGLEYLATDSFAVGSHMTLNFLPEKTLGQRFFFAWQMLGARYSF
ncbi:MAG: hypothetical protein JRF61_00330 [Deltaproteobacteria bacterium]|jgi:hypothetical protein|nr:hypothetical protein [Deltaproteobacteria bacterium]